MQVRGDKIIVFSDNIFALREYAQRLRRPFIFGGTSHAERTRVLAAFKRNPEVQSPFLLAINPIWPQCTGKLSLLASTSSCVMASLEATPFLKNGRW